MKKILSALLAALMLLSATACAAHEPVLPPAGGARCRSIPCLSAAIPCPDAFQEADAVARVKVGDWQGEDLRNWVTFFDASVQESYRATFPGTSPWCRAAVPRRPLPTIPCLPAEPSFWFSCGTMTAAGKNITPSPTITRCCMSCMTKPEASLFMFGFSFFLWSSAASAPAERLRAEALQDRGDLLARGIALRLQEDAVVRPRAGDQLQRHGVGHGGLRPVGHACPVREGREVGRRPRV